MALSIGTEVWSSEHPKSVGRVDRVTVDGAAITFVTAPSASLPFGHEITEWWPVADQARLISMRAAVQASVDSFFSVEGLR